MLPQTSTKIPGIKETIKCRRKHSFCKHWRISEEILLIFQSNSTIICTEIFSEGGSPVYKLDVALQDSSMKQGKINCKRNTSSKLWVHLSSICDTSVRGTLPRHN